MDAKSIKLGVSEFFYSLHGEGRLSGYPTHILRLQSCNLQCRKEHDGFDCDTDFASGMTMSLFEIVNELKALNAECSWLTITGGEPCVQLNDEIVAYLSGHFTLALETNGTIDLGSDTMSAFSHVTISPKTAWHTIRLESCDELRVVRCHGQAIPSPPERFDNALQYLSPAWDNDVLVTRRNIDWCRDLCLSNPEWALSMQMHKLWEVR